MTRPAQKRQPPARTPAELVQDEVDALTDADLAWLRTWLRLRASGVLDPGWAEDLVRLAEEAGR